MYVLNGEPVMQEIPQPDYQTCLAEQKLWLKHVNRAVISNPEAFCVVRDPNSTPR